MDTREKLIAIDDIVRTNKLDVSRGFGSDRLVNAFGDEEEVVADEAIDKIYELCIMGVNSGFTREIRGAIETLSGVVVNLTARNLNTKKINNLKGQVENVNITDKKANKQPEVNPQADIMRYVTTTIGAIDAMIEQKAMFGASVDAQKDNLLALRGKLVQMQETLSKVRNNTSKQAADKAYSIVQELHFIRVQLQGLYCSSEVVSHMDNALSVAEEWVNLSVATDKKNLAKPEDFPPQCGNDTITIMANSARALSDFNLFCLRFDEELEKVNNPEFIRAKEDRLAEIGSKLDELYNQADALDMEVQNNGETAETQRRAQQLVRAIDELTREEDSINAQVDEFKSLNEYRRDIINVFKAKIYDRLMNLKLTKPMQLCGIIGELNMGRILRVVSADCTQQDLEAAQEAVIWAEAQYNEQVRVLNEMTKRLSTVKNVTDGNREQLRRNDPLFNDQQRTTSGRTQVNAMEELRKRRNQRAGNTVTTPNQETAEQKKETNTSQILHLTGDDN